MKYHWRFDAKEQRLTAPSGHSVTVHEIAHLLADRRECRHDFHGEWAGWKMRGNALIPPFSGRNGPRLTPENAKQFLAWVDEPARLDAQRREKPATEGRPALYLVRPNRP